MSNAPLIGAHRASCRAGRIEYSRVIEARSVIRSSAAINELPMRELEPLSLRDRLDARLGRLLVRASPRVQLRLSGRPQVRLDGQDLDPGVQLALRTLELRGTPTMVGAPHSDPPPAEVRARVRREALVFSLVKTRVERVRELEIDGADGRLRARHYCPRPSSSAAKPPLLVFFHGGGFVIGDLDTHDEPCRMLCRHAEVQVLSVDYRLAPEHPFPAGVRDALAAYRWAVAHASELGADASRVAVGGDSAGGNLSAVIAQLAAHDGGPAPVLQLLIYPVVDLTDARSPSGRLFADGFYLTENDRQWASRHYFAGGDDEPTDRRASPALVEDLSGLAPAVVVTAGFDPLRDEGEAYAEALRAAGGRVVSDRMPELIHGFINMTTIPAARDAVLGLAGMVRASLALTN
jgi:acetyl esterase